MDALGEQVDTLRSELTARFGDLRKDVTTQIGSLHGENTQLFHEVSALHTEITRLNGGTTSLRVNLFHGAHTTPVRSA